MSTTATQQEIVLHGRTRWSDHLAAYEFRPGVEFTVTFGGKNAVTHREGSHCLSRTTGDLPTPEKIEVTKKHFRAEVARQVSGEDREHFFCTRCLIRLPETALAPEQILAREAKAAATEASSKAPETDTFNTGPAPKPAAPSKPAGSKITRPARSGRKTATKQG